MATPSLRRSSCGGSCATTSCSSGARPAPRPRRAHGAGTAARQRDRLFLYALFRVQDRFRVWGSGFGVRVPKPYPLPSRASGARCGRRWWRRSGAPPWCAWTAAPWRPGRTACASRRRCWRPARCSQRRWVRARAQARAFPCRSAHVVQSAGRRPARTPRRSAVPVLVLAATGCPAVHAGGRAILRTAWPPRAQPRPCSRTRRRSATAQRCWLSCRCSGAPRRCRCTSPPCWCRCWRSCCASWWTVAATAAASACRRRTPRRQCSRPCSRRRARRSPR